MELSRAEVTPEDMVEVAITGEQVAGKLKCPDETAIHTAVYEARGDVNSVLHMHSHYSILPSIAGKDLVPVCHHGSIFGAVIPVYPDSEKITNLKQGRRMATALGKSKAVIMRGHRSRRCGIECGGSAGCFSYLEENARLFVEASILGTPIPLPEDIELKRAASSTFRPTIAKIWSYFMEKGHKAGIFWDVMPH